MIKNFTVGSDPEFFAVEKGTNNIVPPVKLRLDNNLEVKRIIPGGAIDHPVFWERNNIILHEDGAAFELSVPYVNSNEPEKLYEIIQTGYQKADEIISRFDLELFTKPTAELNLSEETRKEFHSATIFGCDADYDAFKNNMESSTIDVKNWKYRYAGGHIHIGVKEKDILEFINNSPVPLVKILAFTVGIETLVNSPYPKEELLRQKYYGKPGKYRPCNLYGIEYRSPSVAWTNNKKLYPRIFELIEKALIIFLNPDKYGKQVIEDFQVPFIDAYQNLEMDQLQQIQSNILGVL
jgi:hypothetical protein